MTRLIVCSSIILAAVVFFRFPASAQDMRSVPDRQRPDSPPSAVFERIEDAVKSGDVGLLSPYFANQVYLTLSDLEGGFFSQNQASYILRDYFKARRIISFKLSKINEVGGTPFATGGATYIRRGSPELLQVYIALKKAGERWVISQFSVY